MARKQQPQKKAKKKSAATADRFYRRIGAKGWRDSNYFTYSSSSPAFRRWLTAELAGEGLALLSIGCGNGELESYLVASGYRVAGLDLSHPMLKRAARAGLDWPVEADARFLPFAAASFDVVIFPESIGHVPLPEVFAEARRVLRKSGLLIVTTYAAHMGVHSHYRKYRFEDMAPAALEAGFAVEAQRFLAAKQNSVADAPSDAKATLLYFAARAAAAKRPRGAQPGVISPRAKKSS
jgi:ubiquinone/menaquinone biosynthesis C-methylase UbiE